jgi:DNA-binding CsgD family transcriptional regulator
MLFAAALSTPTRGVLAAVVGQAEAGDAIAAAEAAGVLDVEGETIRFSHPLLAAAIYSRAAPDDRRAAHRALAAVVRDTEERARHLARSADAPDESVAAALEEAARAARSRGAGVAAAELAEASVRVTPDTEPEARRRRMMAGADHHLAAGDVPRAVSTLERLARDTDGAARAPILVALGETLLHTSDRAGAGRAFAEALAAAGEDLALRVRTELGLAGVAHLTWVDWRAGEQHAANALRAAEQLGDTDLLLQAIGHQATWSFQMGHGVPRDLMARVTALPEPGETLPLMDHPDHQFGGILEAVGELEDARDRLERLLALARGRRAWYSLPWILMRLARVELAAGSWRRAEEQLDEGRSVAQQSGQDAAVGYLGQVEVQLLALRGDVDRCRAAAAQSMRISEQMGIPHRMTAVVSASALLDLSVRDPAAAFRRLEPLLALDAPGRAEPALLRPMVPLAVEALIGLNRLDEAEAVLAPFEALARKQRRSIALADAGRCRAMLMAARGDLGGAREAAEPARHSFERLGLPFDAARASLTLAEILRRAKQKSAARQAAGAALSAFDTLGAQRWTERAREELARTDARRTPGAELTETEQRIVDLLAAGRTNREIAGTLFMSVHTVEAHLTRIYRSLGVRSRTELARRVLDRGAGGSSRSSEGES